MKTLKEQVEVIKKVMKSDLRTDLPKFKAIKVEEREVKKPKWIKWCKQVADKVCNKYKLGADYKEDLLQMALEHIVRHLQSNPKDENVKSLIQYEAEFNIRDNIEKYVKGFSNNAGYEKLKGRKIPSLYSSTIEYKEKGNVFKGEDDLIFGMKDNSLKERLIDFRLTVWFVYSKLNEKQQKILRMAWQGYTHAEIARQTGYSRTSVLRRVKSFRKYLRKLKEGGLL